MRASNRVSPLLLIAALGGMPLLACGGGDSASTGASTSTTGKSCTKNSDCDDGNVCNGTETCGSTKKCVAGTKAADGTTCTVTGETGNHYCTAGNCTKSRCGDGVVDTTAGEECDDGNSVNGDGCQDDCKYTCKADADCDDGKLCTGKETCDTTSHKCNAGANAANGTACSTESTCTSGDCVCRTGTCVPVGCGNGVVDAGEQCDDGNTVDGDGCDTNCTFSCVDNTKCDNGSVCDGAETCDVATHTCKAGEAMNCDDSNPCTANNCDPGTGCANPLIDADHDGHAPSSLGSCGDDCNDSDATIYLNAPELCDQKDNNCNGQTDESAPTWYKDCDGDGFASASELNSGVPQCAKPAGACSCSGCANDWTATAPSDPGTIDCWDSDPNVKPTQTTYFSSAISGRAASVDFDYNCDGTEQPYYTNVNVSTTASCSSIICCFGAIGGLSNYDYTTGGSGGASGGVDIRSTAPAGYTTSALCFGAIGWQGSTVPQCGYGDYFTQCGTDSAGNCVRQTYQWVYQQCL